MRFWSKAWSSNLMRPWYKFHYFSCYFLNSFTRQNVRCKQALVSSSCGKEAGDFAFYVAKLIDIRHAKRCDMNVDDEYEGSQKRFKSYSQENGSEGENFLWCLSFFLWSFSLSPPPVLAVNESLLFTIQFNRKSTIYNWLYSVLLAFMGSYAYWREVNNWLVTLNLVHYDQNNQSD